MRLIEDPLGQLVCLVVDDDTACCGALTARLMAMGIKQVLTANGGSEAFNILKAAARPIDLILCDVRMPSGNGLQLLQVLRTGHIKSMRVNSCFVLATAYPEVGIIQTASALDANGFVVKPAAPEKFEAAILKARRTIFPPNPKRHGDVFVPEQL
jgi:DNA-binding NtrC family response regulator